MKDMWIGGERLAVYSTDAMGSGAGILVRKILTLARQPLRRKRLAAEAAADLLAARLLVWRRGQYGALRASGELMQAPAAAHPLPGCFPPIARDIAWAVNAAAPWMRHRTPCLIDALAAARMLSRRSIPWVLTVGVGRDDQPDGLIAHAWLSAEGRVLTGRRAMRSVTPMAAYTNRRPIARLIAHAS
jgi:hypothetical protein